MSFPNRDLYGGDGLEVTVKSIQSVGGSEWGFVEGKLAFFILKIQTDRQPEPFPAFEVAKMEKRTTNISWKKIQRGLQNSKSLTRNDLLNLCSTLQLNLFLRFKKKIWKTIANKSSRLKLKLKLNPHRKGDKIIQFTTKTVIQKIYISNPNPTSSIECSTKSPSQEESRPSQTVLLATAIPAHLLNCQHYQIYHRSHRHYSYSNQTASFSQPDIVDTIKSLERTLSSPSCCSSGWVDYLLIITYKTWAVAKNDVTNIGRPLLVYFRLLKQFFPRKNVPRL